jgi:hypothetical protein
MWPCFVQKRQLCLVAGDLPGSLTGQAPQRAREVRLIEVAGIMHDIKDGGAAPQQTHRQTRPLDLSKAAMSKPRGAQQTTLYGSHRDSLNPIPDRSRDRSIKGNYTSPCEAFHEKLRVAEAWNLPSRTLKPESTVGRYGKIHALVVKQKRGRQTRKVCPQTKADCQPPPVRGTRD